MPTIGNLASTASATFDISYCPQFIQVGDPDNADTFDALSITARGVNLVQLTDGAQIRALMQLEAEVIAAGATTELGSRLMLADGRIPGASTVTIGNAGATTTAVYANSVGVSPAKMARRVAVTPVVAAGNIDFQFFDVLYFLPTNFDYAQVEFESGWVEPMTAAELQGLYNANRNTEASGLVNGFVVVEGARAPKGFKVKRITIYAGNGGNCNVVVSKWQKL